MAHKVSDVTNLFYWFGFDAMGDFVFNKSFGMLQNQEWHHIVLLLQRALSLLGPFSPVPWLLQLGLKCMPRISVLKDWFDMVAWCEQQMRERIKVAFHTYLTPLGRADNMQEPDDKLLEPDVAHYLIEDARTNQFQKASWTWLNGDSLLVIVAGRYVPYLYSEEAP